MLQKVIFMYDESKVDKALNFLGMYSSFEEIKQNLSVKNHPSEMGGMISSASLSGGF